MKRVLQHISFWTCYALLCMNMEYLWVSKVLPDMQAADLWTGIFCSAVLGTIPEILFAYYLMYIGYEKLISGKRHVALSLLQILGALLVCLVSVRLLGFYTLKYAAYNGELAESVLWEITIMWRSLIYIGFSSGFSLSLHLFRRQTAAAQREKMLVEEKARVELKLLRNQLQPHFLFNTLNNIYALTRKKSGLAPGAVMKLSELLHFLLYKSDKDTVPLVQEIAFLEDYLSLETMRYSDRLAVRFTKDIDDEKAPVAPLLLLPLVENAFKHGVSETRFDSYIHIALEQKGRHFHFTIENTYDPERPGAADGNVGLRNIRQRLALMYKEHRLEVKKEDCSFGVSLYLNLHSYGEA